MLTFSDNDWTRDYEHVFTLRDIHEAFGLPLGLNDYPIFDEAYRDVLNQRIYDHFAYREIAADTPQMFVFYLNRRMRENMPVYNAIYKQVLADNFDPFATYVSNADGNSRNASDAKGSTAQHDSSTSKATSDSLSRSILSNTPASFMEDPAEPRYMSQLTQNTGNSTNDSTATSDVTNNSTNAQKAARDYIDHVTSRSGYLGDNVLNALSSGFLNTDLMVCDMLEPCFMQLWNDQPR